MAVTLNDLVAMVGRGFGGYESGQANSGSTTTLADSTRIEPDNWFVNYFIRFLDGVSNANVERLVTAYAPGVLTWTLPLGAAVASEAYTLSPVRYGPVVKALGRAVQRAGSTWLAVKVDDTLVLTDNAQSVDLPADCVQVLRVWQYSYANNQTALGGRWDPYTHFEVVGPAGARMLQTQHWAVNLQGASRRVQVEYLALPTMPALPTDTLTLPEREERDAVEFIVEWTLHLLHEEMLASNRTGENAKIHNTLAQQHKGKALEIEASRTHTYSKRVSRSTTIPRMR